MFEVLWTLSELLWVPVDNFAINKDMEKVIPVQKDQFLSIAWKVTLSETTSNTVDEVYWSRKQRIRSGMQRPH
jgi:hypothetical protein